MAKKKNKNKWYFSKEFLIALIIVILFSLGVYCLLSYLEEEFDPDLHDCLDWVYSYGITSDTKNSECGWSWLDRDKDGVNDETVLMCRACLDWEDKTFCELHPDDSERCVCLEDDILDINITIYNYFKEIELEYIKEAMSVVKEYDSIDLDDYECKKIFNGENLIGFQCRKCIQSREKNLDDLSCEELDKGFRDLVVFELWGYKFTKKKDKFFGVSRSDFLSMMVKKDCPIPEGKYTIIVSFKTEKDCPFNFSFPFKEIL